MDPSTKKSEGTGGSGSSTTELNELINIHSDLSELKTTLFWFKTIGGIVIVSYLSWLIWLSNLGMELKTNYKILEEKIFTINEKINGLKVEETNLKEINNNVEEILKNVAPNN